MVIIIKGETHSGKTFLAQQLLEKYKFPYLSIDHLKMGLIRSNYTSLSPTSKNLELTNYLWPIVREIIKTNIENKQNIIIEGSYIPSDIKNEFTTEYLEYIKFINIIFSEEYIKENYDLIIIKENVIEKRLYSSDINIEDLIRVNNENLNIALINNLDYILINTIDDFNEIITKIKL